MINTAGNLPPPEQETEAPNRHIPPEIIEQIFLNLSIKSLLRFSCVANSWKSIITSPQFATKYGSARKIVIINDHPSYFDVRDAFCSPLSTISDHPVGDATPSKLVCPFRADVKLKAFCDDLWCVVAKKSLYLWNPTTGTYKKLRDAPHLPPALWEERLSPKGVKVVYGLGYDAVDDDYKLLKTWRSADWSRVQGRSLLYSLKSDSWRKIQGCLHQDFFPECNGLFVNGALHWMTISHDYYRQPIFMSALISFDFSTEEFRVLKQPMYYPELNLERDVVDVAVLRSKLCVFLNYKRSYEEAAFVLWAMEDYGMVESWTKLYEISYNSIPPIVWELKRGTWFTLMPLYLYEDGRVLIWACSGHKKSKIIVCKDSKVVAHSEILAPSRTKAIATAGGPSSRVRGGFVYAENLVSPKWAPPVQ